MAEENIPEYPKKGKFDDFDETMDEIRDNLDKVENLKMDKLHKI